VRPLWIASLLLAAAATAGLGLLVLRDVPAEPEPAAGDAGSTVAEPEPAAAPAPRLRPYQTTLTLAEDLRDALAGDPALLAAEVWRVSAALESRAVWTLENIAAQEAGPRLRALLVLAAGVHAPEEAALLGFLGDRDALVRRAAVLAVGYDTQGKAREPLMEGVDVPLGRAASPQVQELLAFYDREEKAREVRLAIASVLSSPR